MRLRELREARCWTQKDLADRVGCKQSAIGHWEAGRREPSLGNMKKISAALGVSLDALAGISEQVDHDAAWRGRILALLNEAGADRYPNLIRYVEAEAAVKQHEGEK